VLVLLEDDCEVVGFGDGRVVEEEEGVGVGVDDMLGERWGPILARVGRAACKEVRTTVWCVTVCRQGYLEVEKGCLRSTRGVEIFFRYRGYSLGGVLSSTSRGLKTAV
jgi:hypothetical protein